MASSTFLVAFFASTFVLCTVHLACAVKTEGFEHVTCGSAIKLINAQNSLRLHSHEVKYGTGSGQQSVTGVAASDDTNSYWQVRGAHGELCKRGERVPCNSKIRLTHVNTRRNLHTHNFASPLSQNAEVSAFGEGGEGDTGDSWIVECAEPFWFRDEPVRFKSVDTKRYLHCTGTHGFGRPIAGQFEICGFPRANGDNLWRAEEGIYIKYDEPVQAAPEVDEDDDY
eukprot:Opistho-2@962